MAASIEGCLVRLRAVEPQDVDLMYEWENEPKNWSVSSTRTPFSRYILERFVDSQSRDVYETGQLRLIICTLKDSIPVGTLDLFEIDGYNHRAGVGILIAKEWRQIGYAADALKAAESYATKHLAMNQLWCGVESNNEASISLFSKLGYTEIGVKKAWNWSYEGYIDEVMFQKIFMR